MLKNAWYCAALSNELAGPKPLGRKLLGEHLALFRVRGEVRGVGAVCPHRGADLARGQVVGEHLQCPMHGWCFDAKGQCVKVPSQPEGEKIPPKARTRAWLVREQQGIIWLWGGQPRDCQVPPPRHADWETGVGRVRHVEPARLWKSSFINVVENAIDTTHIPFVHTKTLGADSRRLYPRQKIVVDDDQRGFWGEDSPESPWQAPHDEPLKGGLVKHVLARALGLGRITRESYRVDLGGSVFYKAEYETGGWDVLIAHCTPCDEESTWFFGVSLRTRAPHLLGRAFQSWFARTLCEEDGGELCAMLSNDSTLLPAPVSVVGDEPLLVYRRLYQLHLSRETPQRGSTGFEPTIGYAAPL